MSYEASTGPIPDPYELPPEPIPAPAGGSGDTGFDLWADDPFDLPESGPDTTRTHVLTRASLRGNGRRVVVGEYPSTMEMLRADRDSGLNPAGDPWTAKPGKPQITGGKIVTPQGIRRRIGALPRTALSHIPERFVPRTLKRVAAIGALVVAGRFAYEHAPDVVHGVANAGTSAGESAATTASQHADAPNQVVHGGEWALSQIEQHKTEIIIGLGMFAVGSSRIARRGVRAVVRTPGRVVRAVRRMF